MVKDLLAVRADGFNVADPDRCWADSEPEEKPWACGRTDTDALGLCPFHRAKLFGDAALSRQPNTAPYDSP